MRNQKPRVIEHLDVYETNTTTNLGGHWHLRKTPKRWRVEITADPRFGHRDQYSVQARCLDLPKATTSNDHIHKSKAKARAYKTYDRTGDLSPRHFPAVAGCLRPER
jgi:hypothetical protein